MKKKLLSALLCVAMVASLVVGCGAKEEPAAEAPAATEEAATEEAAPAGDEVYALVVKSAGNPYNEKEAEGFTTAMDELGYKCVVKYPEQATADAQITMINELVAQNVSSIAIAANDADALQPALTAAANAGIKVCSVDSGTNAASRLVHVNQAGTQIIGQTLMDAILDLAGGEGQWAILSAASTATNQNAWIDAMKTVMEGEAYAGLELVEVAYGDDEYQKSVDQTQALLANYPDLKVICAPTTVGIMAAGKVLQDAKSSVKLTGLGLPSEMADYIGADDAHSCPYMYLWNPIDLGKLAAYVSVALVDGTITGAAGETFTCALGDYEIVEAADGGTEIIAGPPFAFTPENIEEWKTVY
jgi:rhamnose transport system substrate-binding protein